MSAQIRVLGNSYEYLWRRKAYREPRLTRAFRRARVSKWHDAKDREYPWSYRLGGVRLYPRSVAFRELGKRGSELRRKIQIAPQLSADEHLSVLSMSATPRS
ncbi:MAG: hypothetical protein ACLP9K_09570 [Nitrososphaerales archaeon]